MGSLKKLQLFAVCAALLPQLSHSEPQIIAEEAYPAVAWRDENPGQPISPPALEPDETVDLWDAAAGSGDTIVLPVKKGSGRVLLVCTPGTTRRIALQSGDAVAAIDRSAAEIVVFQGKKLSFFDLKTLERKRELAVPFGASRTDMAVNGSQWTLRRGASFKVYSLPDFTEVFAFNAPDSPDGKEPQRAVYLSDGSILVNSTYWGARFVRFRPGSPSERGLDPGRSETILIPHRALLRFVETAPNQFAAFDPLTNTYGAYRYARGAYVELTKGLQVFGDWAAVRSSPREQTLSYRVSIKPEQNADSSELLVLLPPRETYSQSISDEKLPADASIIKDRHGNRYAKIPAGQLAAGVTKEIEVYRARIRRYMFRADLDSFEDQLSRRSYPSFLNSYTVDFREFDITNPIVKSTTDRIARSAGSSASIFLKKTLDAAAAIPYKSDGRFDPAPVIITQNHGSCTEHTYFINAVLRAHGVPGRTVWVWLPGDPQPSFNHKIAETWLPGFGWVPMESLSPPRAAGAQDSRLIVFGAFDHGAESLTSGGDTLAKLTAAGRRANARVSLDMTLDPSEKGGTPRARSMGEMVE